MIVFEQPVSKLLPVKGLPSHVSSDGRVRVTYGPDGLVRKDIAAL